MANSLIGLSYFDGESTLTFWRRRKTRSQNGRKRTFILLNQVALEYYLDVKMDSFARILAHYSRRMRNEQRRGGKYCVLWRIK